jgi:Tol biopolymer transport system component
LEDLTSGSIRHVAQTVGWGRFIDWSPDSAFILFREHQEYSPTTSQLLLVDTNTQVENEITPDNKMVTSASWSPDGRQIAYGLCDPETEHCQIWLADRDDGDSHTIPFDLSLPAHDLDWSPDGDRLIFIIDYGTEPRVVWSIRTDGTDLRPVIHNAYDCRVLDTP